MLFDSRSPSVRRRGITWRRRNTRAEREGQVCGIGDQWKNIVQTWNQMVVLGQSQKALRQKGLLCWWIWVILLIGNLRNLSCFRQSCYILKPVIINHCRHSAWWLQVFLFFCPAGVGVGCWEWKNSTPSRCFQQEVLFGVCCVLCFVGLSSPTNTNPIQSSVIFC